MDKISKEAQRDLAELIKGQKGPSFPKEKTSADTKEVFKKETFCH